MSQGPTAAKRTELQMARSMCWHCQSEVTGEYFCEQCVKVQPVSKETDYFTAFGLPRRLRIDPAALEAKFYQLSRSFHPDFYQQKSETERAISLQNSAMLNTAYRTLKEPIQRVEYLLSLEAGAAKEIRTSPPADLFEEILELQEDLDAFRSAGAGDDTKALRTKLNADRDSLERRQRDMDSRLLTLFGEWDAMQEAPVADPQKRMALLKEMREILSNRTYLRNIIDDLVSAVSA
ncbi:MAG TPA: Fe-S protein assembly co-chaperone HscB [Nitrospirales bacterium]|nr:Fe-S protein assembly co-chaperone HscB [Nitrospirales bacterium]